MQINVLGVPAAPKRGQRSGYSGRITIAPLGRFNIAPLGRMLIRPSRANVDSPLLSLTQKKPAAKSCGGLLSQASNISEPSSSVHWIFLPV